MVGGPFASLRFSRYDIVDIAQNFEQGDEFVILLDDYNREGEKETFERIKQTLEKKNIPFYHQLYTELKLSD